MSVPSAAVVRSSGGGEDIWLLGGLYSYKARPAETGAYLACEVQARAGFAIPVHFHDAEEEGFYVARGDVTIFLDGSEHRLAAGGFALAPRGTRHAFRFESPDSVLLLLLSPGGKHEEMFRAMGERALEHRIPDSLGAVDASQLPPIAERYGTFIVAPPPTR